MKKLFKSYVTVSCLAVVGLCGASARAQEPAVAELSAGQLILVILPYGTLVAQDMEFLVKDFQSLAVPLDLSGCGRAGPFFGNASAIITGKHPEATMGTGFSTGGIDFAASAILKPGTRLHLEPLGNPLNFPMCTDTSDTSPSEACTCVSHMVIRDAVVLTP